MVTASATATSVVFLLLLLLLLLLLKRLPAVSVKMLKALRPTTYNANPKQPFKGTLKGSPKGFI